MVVKICSVNKRAGVTSNRYVRRLGAPPLPRRRSRTSPSGRRSPRCPWAPRRDLHPPPQTRPHKVSNRIKIPPRSGGGGRDGDLDLTVAEDDVVAALRQNEELRDHPHHAAASADTPSPRAGRPGCDCNVTRRSEAVDRRLCVSQPQPQPQPHLPCRDRRRLTHAKNGNVRARV